MSVDVLVIGSGFGACAPALRLVEAGARVKMLERGPRISTGDFRQTQDPTYYMKYYRKIDSRHLSFNYIEALGGGSGFYEMASFRAPTKAFAQTDRSGARAWPSSVGRKTLDPFYERAEAMLNVHQLPAERVPKNGVLFGEMMRRLGYSAERARYASRGCLDSGYCLSGCIYGAKQSLLVTYLPDAEAEGLQVQCDTEAVEIRPDGSGYVVSCRTPDGWTEERAPVVIVAGGVIGSVKLLMHSKRLRLSDQLGKHITHNGTTKSAALLGDAIEDGDLFRGRSHAGMMSYHFLESDGFVLSAEKPLPLQIVSAARARRPGDDPVTDFWGARHTELMMSMRRRGFILAALGLVPPDAELTKTRRGVKLHLKMSPELDAYLKRAHEVITHILEENGCTELLLDFVDNQGAPYPDLHLSGAHQMGGARMADSPDNGVVDASGRVFGHEGLYVTDGAALCSSLAVNPSLTILANDERIADGLVARYG